MDEGESRHAPLHGRKRVHDELSERVEDLQRELRKVWRNMGQAPRRVRGIPFAKNIMVDELLASFRPVKCRVFATTLIKSAQTWFSQLGDGIILGFDQLTVMFLHQFASSRKQMRSTQTLFEVKQKDNEPLSDFVKRFTTATLESPEGSDDLIVSAIIQGLEERELHTSLIKRGPINFDDLLQLATKYINLQEAVKLKKGEVLAKVEKLR